MNSYMLPHGQRPAASPRRTTPAMCEPAPTTVSATPMRPNRLTRYSFSAGAATSGPPAPTSTCSRSVAGLRAEAHSIAWAVIASR